MINSLTKTRAPETIKMLRNLSYARCKLLDKEISMQLRVMSYIRMSCSSFQNLKELNVNGVFIQLQDIQSFLLLKSLSEYDSRWWERCIVSNQDILESENSVIKDLLLPLSKLHCYCCIA
jgi:hypothetical protein